MSKHSSVCCIVDFVTTSLLLISASAKVKLWQQGTQGGLEKKLTLFKSLYIPYKLVFVFIFMRFIECNYKFQMTPRWTLRNGLQFRGGPNSLQFATISRSCPTQRYPTHCSLQQSVVLVLHSDIPPIAVCNNQSFLSYTAISHPLQFATISRSCPTQRYPTHCSLQQSVVLVLHSDIPPIAVCNNQSFLSYTAISHPLQFATISRSCPTQRYPTHCRSSFFRLSRVPVHADEAVLSPKPHVLLISMPSQVKMCLVIEAKNVQETGGGGGGGGLFSIRSLILWQHS